MQDSCQGDIDKLKKELVACQADKRYYERMVERLNKEMEARMNNVKRDSKFELNKKEEKMKEIYGRVAVADYNNVFMIKIISA